LKGLKEVQKCAYSVTFPKQAKRGKKRKDIAFKDWEPKPALWGRSVSFCGGRREGTSYGKGEGYLQKRESVGAS